MRSFSFGSGWSGYVHAWTERVFTTPPPMLARFANSLPGRAIAGLGRYQWAAAVGLVFFTTSAITRVALTLRAGTHALAGASQVAHAFLAGAVYDVFVALWLTAPVVVYLTFARRSHFRRRTARGLRRLALGGALGTAIFVAVSELIFFDEFNGRFNFVAVDYLLYPTEVITNIWQSYHVAWALAGIAAVIAIAMRRARPWLRRLDERDGPVLRVRLSAFAAYTVVLLLLSRVVTPSLAHVSDDRVINEIGGNGYYAFWRALLGRDAAYEGLYATRPDSVVMAALPQLVADASLPRTRTAGRGTARAIRSSVPPRRLNVVVILEESFGSTFVGALHRGDSASGTPAFDSLTDEGTLLTHVYSTGNRTIRALEATTSSLPPLPGVSIVRRPRSVDLFTLPALLRAAGYATEFIYGGRAMFDGMGTYMLSNGIERVVEQRDYPSGTFSTAWGVADEAIFTKALAEMDSLHTTGKPFYTLVLTVSNHRPYTYPSGRIPQDPAEKRRTFAVRYADWALGQFMRNARSHAFFDNTLFVVMGDHGARVYGAAEIPLPSYEVPVLFYAPRVIRAGARVGTLASSLDIPPTILGVLGLTYESKFFGRDVFREDSTHGRALMAHNAELALMRGNRMAVLGLKGATTVYAVDSTDMLTPVRSPTDADRALVEEAIAYYEGADLLYRRGAYRIEYPVLPEAHH